MSRKRLLQFFLKSSWSLLLWQYLFKRCLYDYMDLIYNRRFQYSWCVHYILLFKGNQKFNRKSKNSDWTPSLYQQEKVKKYLFIFFFRDTYLIQEPNLTHPSAGVCLCDKNSDLLLTFQSSRPVYQKASATEIPTFDYL